MSEQYPMRRPCRHCDHMIGRLETRGGQDCVFCLGCGRLAYNAPKTETGREVRSLKTRPDIKVSQRSRILDRDGGACIVCHASDRPLDIGHIVSVDDGKQLGMTEDELYHDENLAAMCNSCNSGYSSVSINPRLFLRLVRARILRSAA